MINDKADDIVEEFFQSLLSRYQIWLETSMRGSDFSFDCVHLLYYKWHEISFKRGESYIDFPHWRKKTKKQQYIVSIKKIMNVFDIHVKS